jgi:hypothetical protein
VRTTFDIDVIVDLTSTLGFATTDELLRLSASETASAAPVRPTHDVEAAVAAASYAELRRWRKTCKNLAFANPSKREFRGAAG